MFVLAVRAVHMLRGVGRVFMARMRMTMFVAVPMPMGICMCMFMRM